MPLLHGAAPGLHGMRGPSEWVPGCRRHNKSWNPFGIGTGEGVFRGWGDAEPYPATAQPLPQSESCRGSSTKQGPLAEMRLC